MRAGFFDRHSRLDSPVHRLPATVKFSLALLIVLTVVLAPWPVWVGIAGLLVIVAGGSRIPRGFLLRRLLWFEPFVLGVAVLALLQPQGGAKFIALVTKSTLCVFTMILLSNTTPFSELLRVLRTWHVPGLLVTTIALMYRYLFVLVEETERMRRARASRSFGRQHRRDWHTRASVIGQLFIRSSERAERIYAAMCARGWQ